MDSTRKAKTGTDVGRQPVKATILNVLIASPSDVSAQRNAVESAIQEWNANHHAETGVMLQAVRWESHSYPASGDRPQAIINQQIVDQGDFLIGIFGNRLGTPTGAAQSGTIEEIEQFRKAGKHVALYFSTADVPETPTAINSRPSKTTSASGKRIRCTRRSAQVKSCGGLSPSTCQRSFLRSIKAFRLERKPQKHNSH